MKKRLTHAMTVKVPLDVYQDLAALADARGLHVTSVVNWILTEARGNMRLAMPRLSPKPDDGRAA